MSSPNDINPTTKARGLSVDEWAVVAALIAALLVRVGIITHVPW
jgi:hypothetical protein